MKLFIAEKASLGRAIADALPGSQTKRGTHIEMSNGDIVTWASGHLVEQVDPDVYDGKWKAWGLNTLPIVVSKWKIQPITIKKKFPSAEDKSRHGYAMTQLGSLKALMEKADIIVNAGDPDREGQLIVDELIEFYKQGHKPQQRIWLNAVDAASAKKAIDGIEDNKSKKYRDLHSSALCRQRADWLVGMNMTRAVTLAMAQSPLVASVGRVQTPTLALVVRRCLDIENFIPKNFYEIEMDVLSGKDKVTLTFSTTDHEKRLWDKKAADKLAADLHGLTVTLGVISAEKTANPPPLFHLPDFQKYAGAHLKWGVTKSLEVLQKLYEAKLTTYPRTDSNKLPKEQEPQGLPIGRGLIKTGHFNAAMNIALATRPYVYSCSKDEPHHAVVPTQVIPGGFADQDMEQAWKIIATRFLMSLMPSHRYTETVISTKENGYLFSIKGEMPLTNPASTWLSLSSEQRKATSVPHIKDGSTGVVQTVRVVGKKTSCPDYYTEATLIEDMRSVAKFVTNDKLKAILKETSGIGTAATQAATIEGIKVRGYIQPASDKKNEQKLMDTPFGRSLIQNLPSQLKDPCLTAAWEDALKMIAAGTYSSDEFMTRITRFVDERLKDVVALRGKVLLSSEKGRCIKQAKASSKTSLSKTKAPGKATKTGSSRKSTPKSVPRARTVSRSEF